MLQLPAVEDAAYHGLCLSGNGRRRWNLL